MAAANIFIVDSANGFAIGRVAGPEAELLTIAVLPDARRNGVGRALLCRFENGARERGAKETFLEVAADNTAASRLYESQGYARCSYRKDYHETPTGPKIAALLYKKPTPRN